MGRTLSESDGYYSYLGLVPGTYTVQIDEEQLATLKMNTRNANKTTFEIIENKEGHVADGLDFVLLPHDNKLLLPHLIFMSRLS